MLYRTKLSLAVSAAFGAGLAGMAPGVAAQTEPQKSLERVEVTGSLLRRIEAENALPVTTISADELIKAGEPMRSRGHEPSHARGREPGQLGFGQPG